MYLVWYIASLYASAAHGKFSLQSPIMKYQISRICTSGIGSNVQRCFEYYDDLYRIACQLLCVQEARERVCSKRFALSWIVILSFIICRVACGRLGLVVPLMCIFFNSFSFTFRRTRSIIIIIRWTQQHFVVHFLVFTCNMVFILLNWWLIPVCVLHIKPPLLPVDIQHTAHPHQQWQCRFLFLEIYHSSYYVVTELVRQCGWSLILKQYQKRCCLYST